ncbi:MAG: hypothetical protein MK213_01115 [Planctomycetes bacterium]|nr:hypothetical protein [Planctomycetota bacterium]
MQENLKVPAPIQLYHQLQDRLLSDASLQIEWTQAQEDFGHTSDIGALNRCMEWFLFEREAHVFGHAPAFHWAPSDLTPENPWMPLLDNFLGIFIVKGDAPNGGLLLEDLWSGRAIVAALPPQTPPKEGCDRVFMGRWVLVDETLSLPLPGLCTLEAPRLIAALEADLNKERANNSRAKLSQLSCEQWLQGLELETGATHSPREELEKLFEGVEELCVEDVIPQAKSLGLSEVMNQMAFQTDLDLQKVQSLLSQLLIEEKRTFTEKEQLEDNQAPGEEDVQKAVGQFLRAFEEGSQPEAAIEAIETALNMSPDSEEPWLENGSGQESFGPQTASGLSTWIAMWAWEQSQEEQQPSESKLKVIQMFCDWAESQAEEPLDAHEIQEAQVWSFLLMQGNVHAVHNCWESLSPFLMWAWREQFASLERLWEKEGEQVMCRIIESLEERSPIGDHPKAQVRLAQVNPYAVVADQEERARVLGLDPNSTVSPGDLLLGHWEKGIFVAHSWMPQEAIPSLPNDQQINPQEDSRGTNPEA